MLVLICLVSAAGWNVFLFDAGDFALVATGDIALDVEAGDLDLDAVGDTALDIGVDPALDGPGDAVLDIAPGVSIPDGVPCKAAVFSPP